MYAMGSDVRAFQLNQDHQFAFISGEKRIQAIDFDVTKGETAFSFLILICCILFHVFMEFFSNKNNKCKRNMSRILQIQTKIYLKF